MPPKKLIIALMCALSTTNVFSQFYTELFSANQQIYRTVDKSGQDSVFTYNQFVNFMLPIVRKNQDAIIIRGSYERLQSIGENGCQTLSSLALPVGYSWTSTKKPTWKYLALAQAKLSGTWEQGTDWKKQMQYGAVFLATKTIKPEFRWKVGLYVSKEAFGPFVIPLVGWDWKINQRWKMIGFVPNSLKIEYSVIQDALNIGWAYRSNTRSFYNTPDGGYIRYNEMQLKSYIEYHFKSYYVFLDGGYFIGKAPRYFDRADASEPTYNALYLNAKPFFLLNFGVALRLAN